MWPAAHAIWRTNPAKSTATAKDYKVMMENREYRFAREDIVTLLCEVTSQYARRNGPPLDVLIYGGAAVTLRHKFRTAANDIDYALREPSPLFEDCVEDVGKRYRLPPFWMHRLEQGITPGELAARLDGRALYYEKVYRWLFPLLRRKDDPAARKICWVESLFWRTEGDVQTTLARYGIHLSPVIVNHIARVMFKPEFWSLL